MVALSGLAERTFKRRFAKATGLTPISYVQQLRIEHAKRLLERTDLSTERVCFEVGYAEPASFRRLFKRITHLTPAEYRRRIRVPAVLPNP
jgi:transcriptional regulator GlxA family with amidase domain